MEVLDGRSDYIDMVNHYHLDSALRSFVTPPRRTPKSSGSRRVSYDSRTPPDTFSRSPPKNQRNSPSRLSPCQLNGKGGFYAGAKFGERPSPADLPKPPIQWVNDNLSREQSCMEMTNSLKVLLKVQA